MTESDARAVLLVRAFETARDAAWHAADAAWASAEARRREGEHAPFEQWLACRAHLACTRLVERDQSVATLLQATGWHAWVTWGVIGVAFIAGVASDAFGGQQRINLLAPPLLALLVWNLAVYALLVLRRLTGRRDVGALRRLLRALLNRVRAKAQPANAPVRMQFVHSWTSAAQPLYGARITALLHAAAAALVLGALASMYLRGLAFEYRAGWESTFLDAADVHAIVTLVLGPAARLSGIALPDVTQVAALRFSAGGGENAARWIHLYAVTLGLAVLLPRTLLAAAAAWQAHTAARQFPLPLDDDYFARLRRAESGQPVQAGVLSYSYAVTDARRNALQTVLEQTLAPRVLLTFHEVPLGGEDHLEDWLSPDATAAAGEAPGISPARAPRNAPAHASVDASMHASPIAGADAASPLWVALFSLAATPERENHGAFVRALAARVGAERLHILVDEAGFRERFNGADLATRLAQRRSAWVAMLSAEGHEATFVDLSRAEVAGAQTESSAAAVRT
ncbi:MAG TPA: DUF2868 domain-containing protein [Burkholderiaceae bacterium]|nr:DUF2868 domain-containing protein [Burkholderiaceae bacterium]